MYGSDRSCGAGAGGTASRNNYYSNEQKIENDYKSRKKMLDGLINAVKSVCEEIEEPILVSAVKEAFYRQTRESFIKKLRQEVKKQDWTRAIQTIGSISGRKELFESHIECKILDSMSIRSWTTDDYVVFYLELLSLNFSEERFERLRGKIIEKKKGRS